MKHHALDTYTDRNEARRGLRAHRIEDMLNQQLARLFNPWGIEESEDKFLSPRIEIKDKEKAIIVSAELPGMNAEDIEVTCENGLLTITGEKKETQEDCGAGYCFTECSYGSIRRQIPLPEGIETDKISADYEKGILKIVIPKQTEHVQKTKKITVKSK